MTKYSLTIPLPSLHRPVDVKRGNATQAKTTARYPVRSGPKQFASYLSDMGSLIVEILSGTMMVSIGTAEIPHLGQLSPTRSIIGFFPIISPTEEKIGDLHVALVIESLMGRYIIAKWVALQIRPRGYKTFFMLSSGEHEIFSANKYENANNSWHFHIYQLRNFLAQLCLARKNLQLLVTCNLTGKISYLAELSIKKVLQPQGQVMRSQVGMPQEYKFSS